MTNQQLDYSKMLFNTLAIDTKDDVLEKIPRLKVYKEFTDYGGSMDGLPNRNMVIKHIFQFYDKNWPYQELKSYQERMEKSLLDAGFKKKKDEWPDDIKGLIRGEYKEVKAMVRCFLFKMQNCKKFAYYNAMEMQLEDLLDNIQTPIKEEDVSKKETAFKTRHMNSKSAGELINDIENLEKELFQDRDDIRDLIGGDKQASEFRGGFAEMLSDMRKK